MDPPGKDPLMTTDLLPIRGAAKSAPSWLPRLWMWLAAAAALLAAALAVLAIAGVAVT